MVDNLVRQKYEKIARLLKQEVPQTQIALVCGLDEARISQIKTEVAFQEIMAGVLAEDFERDQALNNGWDGIEARGLKIVYEAMETNRDKDFALKAAVMANKAQRPRLFRGNNPINANGNGNGMTAVVNLNIQMVEKLNSGISLEHYNFSEVPQKAEDSLTPKQVKHLLEFEEDKDTQEFQDIVEGLAVNG